MNSFLVPTTWSTIHLQWNCKIHIWLIQILPKLSTCFFEPLWQARLGAGYVIYVRRTGEEVLESILWDGSVINIRSLARVFYFLPQKVKDKIILNPATHGHTVIYIFPVKRGKNQHEGVNLKGEIVEEKMGSLPLSLATLFLSGEILNCHLISLGMYDCIACHWHFKLFYTWS